MLIFKEFLLGKLQLPEIVKSARIIIGISRIPAKNVLQFRLRIVNDLMRKSSAIELLFLNHFRALTSDMVPCPHRLHPSKVCRF